VVNDLLTNKKDLMIIDDPVEGVIIRCLQHTTTIARTSESEALESLKKHSFYISKWSWKF